MEPSPHSPGSAPRLPDQSLINTLLTGAFGSRASLVESRLLKASEGSYIFDLELADPGRPVILKLASPDSPRRRFLARLPAIYRLAGDLPSLPVPRVLGAGITGDNGWQFILLEKKMGLRWDTLQARLYPTEQEDCRRQIGQALAVMQGVTFPAFGELEADGCVRPNPSLAKALQNHAGTILPDPQLVEVFARVLAAEAGLFTAPDGACLCHEDLNGSNLLFTRAGDRWILTGLLDFDKAWAGPPEADLARLEFWDGMTSPAFWEGYLETRRISPEYARRRPIYQLLWCLEYARAEARHLRDTQTLLQALGQPGAYETVRIIFQRLSAARE